MGVCSAADWMVLNEDSNIHCRNAFSDRVGYPHFVYAGVRDSR